MVAVVWPNGLTETEPRRSDPYGPRKPITTPAGTTRPFHVGGDWVLGGGKSHSILAGTVEEVGRMGALGLQVLVDVGVIGGHHYWVRTCHLENNSVRVRRDDTVSAGTVLGIEGDTGLSVGVHTHLEVYRDGLDRGSGVNPGNTIDPRGFILALMNGPASLTSTPFNLSPEEDDMIAIVQIGNDQFVADYGQRTKYNIAVGQATVANALEFREWLRVQGVRILGGAQPEIMLQGFRDITDESTITPGVLDDLRKAIAES